MHVVKPEVYIIAETQIAPGMLDMLESIGAPLSYSTGADHLSRLVEVCGRLCYKSFDVGMNANVTKIREDQREYIGNILKQRHGSVLEHSSVSVAFIGVSRIFTHELVRHRAGFAYSQESMRFVRLDDIGMYIPDLTVPFTDLAESRPGLYTGAPKSLGKELNEKFSMAMHKVARDVEVIIAQFTKLLDSPGVSFHIKKTITSALRRMAPSGHTTNIIATGNMRAWRHVIENRTAEGAEVEIREVFLEVAHMFQDRYPNLFQDMIINTANGVVSFEHSKI